MIRQKGQSLVELLVVIGLSAIILPAFLTGLISSRSGRAQQQQKDQATIYLKETEEILRHIKDTNWENVNKFANPYHIDSLGNDWVLDTGTITTGDFTRSITLSQVRRDNSGKISNEDSDSIDPSIIKAITTISWNNPISTNLSTTTYLTRYNSNVTQKIDSTIVELEKGGGGDWCKPQQSIVATYDLLHSGIPVSITAVSSDSENLAYTTTGNNSSGNSVDKLTISQVGSSFTVNNPKFIKDNTAYGIYSDGTKLYFNEKKPPGHIVRVVKPSDLSNIGFFDADNATGKSVYALGTIGYVTTDDSKFYAFDLGSSQTEPYPPFGVGITLAGIGNKVIVVGSNAYIATNNPTKQLQIVNVTDPSSMNITKSIDLGNNQGATDLFVDSDQKYVYIITNNDKDGDDSFKSFFIVDLNNTNNIFGYTNNISVGESGAGKMNPQGIVVVSTSKAIIVGCNDKTKKGSDGNNCPIDSNGSWNYQVFDVSSPSTAFRCGGLNPSGVSSINSVAGVQINGNVYSYIITDNTSTEFQIIKGGSGSSGDYSDYYYPSPPIDTLTFTPPYPSVVFNRFTFSGDNLTTGGNWIKFRVAAADPGPSGNCSDANYIFVGSSNLDDPDTYTSWFSDSNSIPWNDNNTGYENPARCFKYYAWLHPGDPKTTTPPVLKSFTVNYSP